MIGGARREMRRLLVVGGLGLLALGTFSGVAGAATTAPFTDPNAVGTIGLCNQAGQQVTSGSTTTAPFAWLAVSTAPAPAPYNNASRTAILLAYQPQNGLPPGEWSGAELTASSRYTNPDLPMAAATSGDDSLADFMSNYHPRWDGFLQLRMYLGTADAVQYSLHYPSLDIQVQGTTWTAVGEGPVSCKAGTAESLESIVLPSTTTTPSTSGGAGSKASGTSGTGTGSGSGSGKGSASPTSHPSGTASGPTSSPATGAVATATASGSSLGWMVAVLVVLLVAVAMWLVLRRRRPDPAGGTSVAGDTGPSGSGQAPTDVTDADATDQASLRTDQTVSSSSSATGTSMKGQHQ
jgi:hypothetical protein